LEADESYGGLEGFVDFRSFFEYTASHQILSV
jgi:hypothetical protein